MKTTFSPFPLVLCLVAAALSAAQAQTASKEQKFDLKQPGSQTLNLGKLPWQGQRAGRIRFVLAIDSGELAGTVVLRMLSGDGTDLAIHLKLGGFNDPTRVVELKGLKPGSPNPVSVDFVGAAGTAAVGVELKTDVTKAPCALRVEGLTIEERTGGAVGADTSGAGGRLVTSPEAGFPYANNLLPPLDAPEWRAEGVAAKRSTTAAGQTVLVLDENESGRWESPVVPLKAGARELCLQAFIKIDALATPFEHPIEILFRDAQGKVLPVPGLSKHWPWAGWTFSNGQWIPITMRFAVPDHAVSTQLVLKISEVAPQDWHSGNEKKKNNFIAFQMAGLRLWALTKATPERFIPFDMTAWAGGLAGPGPFTPSSPTQQNSVVLTSRVNDTNNLFFSRERKWPSPRAWVQNYLPIRRAIEFKGEVFDWAGVSVGKVSVSVTLKPYETRDVELPVASIKRTGIYSMNLDAMQDGALVGQGVIRWGCFTGPSDRADRLDKQYPFCFHPLFCADGGGYKDAARLNQEAAGVRALGARSVRLQCRLWEFDAAEPEKSIASVRAVADSFQRQVWPVMQRHGLQGFISFFPEARSPIPASEPDLAAWRQYVAAAVKAYPQFSTFIFGNEEVGLFNVDLDNKALNWGYLGSMRDYTRQFLSARQAAIEARPEIVFIVGEASDPDSNVARLFFEAGGTAKDVQGWAINSYNDSPRAWESLSKMLVKHGVDLTNAVGVIPENGYNTPARGPNRLSGEKAVAISLIRSHVQSLIVAPWIRDFAWFATAFAGAENHGVLDGDWSPKPMAGAYLTMTASLGAGRPSRVAELPGVNAYVWQRPDGSKAGVVWAPGRQRMRLRVGETAGPVIIRDIMGNDVSVTPKDGVIAVDVVDAPTYLLNIRTLEDGSEVVADWTLERAEDGARLARVEIRNRSTRPLQIKGRFEGPPEVAWSQTAIDALTLQPGGSKVVAEGFQLMEADFADLKTLTLSFKANGAALTSDFSSSLLTVRRVATPPSPGAGGKSWEKADTVVMHRQGEIITHWAPRWSGPDDLSARCSMLWDTQNLYFRAEVRDNANVQETVPDSMFRNDNIQLAVTADAGTSEFSLGISDGRPIIYVYGHAGQAAGVMDAKDARLSIVRDEASRTTVYEAAIAWKALGIAEPKPGRHLRFAILVNDSDRPGADGGDRQAIQWFGGIFSKDPAKFGDLTLSN